MKKISIAVIVVGVLSILGGILSRITMQPLPLAPGGVEASVLLKLASTCFLLAIALLLVQSVKE
ncbi:MAG: hypothetical protein ABIA66_00250 [Candidatus Omnitrophota bacterium]